MKEDAFPYEDIIDLPHHVSSRRRPMPLPDRAAQFAPFAALTGYGEAVEETARLTEGRVPLTDEMRDELDRRMRLLVSAGPSAPAAEITYFVEDERKAGGRYVSIRGRIAKLARLRRSLVMEDGSEIPAADIIAIDSPVFRLSEDGGEEPDPFEIP